jgi:nanoRNase/pAp phosphatase (c-di-AMP/oligoRNAs hydrolase)
MSRLVYHENTGIAYLVINKYDLEQSNSSYNDAGHLISLFENNKDITVIYLIIKNTNSLSIKARSDVINVCKIMKCFGGGGHVNAAGTSNYKCRNFYRFIENLIEKTKKELNCL